MPRLSPDAVQRRSEMAWDRKRQWDAMRDEAYELHAPGLNPYSVGYEPDMQGVSVGDERHNELYDSTGVRDAAAHAEELVTTGAPKGKHWAKMKAGPILTRGDPNKHTRAEKLQAVQRRAFDAIHASNFFLASLVSALDCVIAGTGLMRMGRSPDPATLLHCDPTSPAEAAIDGGPRNEVWGVHRKMALKAEHAFALWPEARLADVQAERSMGGDMAEPVMHTYLESTYYDPMPGMWYYDVILRGGTDGQGSAMRVWERDYMLSPWVVWRYRLMSGEVNGRGPAFANMPDARTLQIALKTRLQSASLRVAGMWTYRSGGAFNPKSVRWRSGALIPVDSNANDNPTMRPLEVGGDVALGEAIIADTRESTSKTFNRNALPPMNSPIHSPTEIIERRTEKLQALGPAYARMEEEWLRPSLRLATYLLAEAGEVPELAPIMPPMPEQGGRPRPLRLDGTDIALEFTSPLAQTQDYEDARSTVEFLTATQQTAGPAGYQAGVRVENIGEVLGEKWNADARLIRDEGERAAMLQAGQQQAQAQPQGGMGRGVAP